MRHILSPGHLRVLRRFAGGRTLLALDFDGTLAPIVRDPEAAALRPSTRRLLRRAAHAYPCIVVTGRARADAARRLRGLGLADVIGNHGMERGPASRRRPPRLEQWRAALADALADAPGVWVEDKGLSLAVHWRRARSKRYARELVLAAVSGLEGVRLVGGKDVVNVMPAGAPNKGTAVERARRRLRCEAAIYVGDDKTDEDVFSLARPGRLLSVRVGRERASAAAYYLRDQSEIDRLLERLLALRPTGSPRPRRSV
jgi:trehalose 6-phosphate phosphatase